jgi:hypothetical protein
MTDQNQNQGIISALINLIRDQGKDLAAGVSPSIAQMLALAPPPKVPTQPSPRPPQPLQAPLGNQATAGVNPWGAVAPEGIKPEQAFPQTQNSKLMQLLNMMKGGPATAQPVQNPGLPQPPGLGTPQPTGQTGQMPPEFLKLLLSILMGSKNAPPAGNPPAGNLSGTLQR